MDCVLVSICCWTYNQEKFIRRAVDSFLMQKTDFNYEILLNDDGSTDGTAIVLQKYERNFPDLVRTVFQSKNQWKEKMLKGQAFGYEPFCYNLLPLAKGKYLALCEGDDFWTDPKKLAIQIRYMEEHPKCSMTYHKTDLLYEDGKRTVFDPLKNGNKSFTAREMVSTPPGIATASKVLRNYYNQDTKKWYEFASGDYLMNAYYATMGGCDFVPGINPSIYRIHSGGVWSGMKAVNQTKSVKALNLKIYELYKKMQNNEFICIRNEILQEGRIFGIVIPIYQRGDGKSLYYLKRCIESIYRQTYQGFKIYIIGDDYINEKEVEKFIKPYEQFGNLLFWKNLPVAIERRKYTGNKEALWCAGGVNATNYALGVAEQEGIQYACFLDYDDYWKPNHLELINKTINETGAVWLCTKTSLNPEETLFLPRGMQNEKLKEFLPAPGDCIKSSVCFNLQKLPFRGRDVFAETGEIIPSDADLWGRMAKYINSNNLKSYYIGEHTCVHDDEGYVRRGGAVKLRNKERVKAKKIDELITGVVVCYNTKDLMQRAYESVRKFHSNMMIIVIDGSDKDDPCYKYIQEIVGEKTRVFHATRNIGHGRGLKAGLSYVRTPFALVFDSDIEMLKSPLSQMIEMVEDDTYGVGYVEKTAFDGHEWGSKPEHKIQGWMRYLHPYFCLIQMKEYNKYATFIHHGAPAVNTCLDIHRKGLGKKAIKEFPGLGHSSGKGWVWEGKPREFIRHDTRGTREMRTQKGLEEIEGTWDKVLKI